MWVRLMEYTKIKNINEYVSESVSPMNTPEQIFEMYSVPIYSTGHPEYLHGNEIASNKVKVRKNDVLLCKINPRINRVWIVADESAYPCIASSEWIVIRNSEYNPEFLAWYFRSPIFKQLMTSEVTGIGGSLTRAQPKAVAEYPVPVIERQEQDVITEILNKIYNIIDTRRREINILDDLIKARFAELFGNPVLNDKGWEQKTLADIASKIGSGATPKGGKEAYRENGIALVRSMNVHNGRFEYKDLAHISDEQAEKLNNVTLEENDVLLNITGASVARSCVVPSEILPARVNQHVCIIRCKECIVPEFLNKLFINDNYQVLLRRMAGAGATREAITKQQVESLRVIMPPLEIQQRFADFVARTDKSKVAVQKSLDETQLLFNSLMQKYFG